MKSCENTKKEPSDMRSERREARRWVAIIVLVMSSVLLEGRLSSMIAFEGYEPGGEDSVMVVDPNPVRERATIRFTLPVAGHTTISLLDARGKPVATILDAAMEQGRHKISWNFRGFRGGVYIIVLRSGGYVEADVVQLGR